MRPSPLMSAALAALASPRPAGFSRRVISCHVWPGRCRHSTTSTGFTATATSRRPSPLTSARSANITCRPTAPMACSFQAACPRLACAPGFSSQKTPVCAPLRSLKTTSRSPSPSMSCGTSDITQPASRSRWYCQAARLPGDLGACSQPTAAPVPLEARIRSGPCWPSTSMAAACIHDCDLTVAGKATVLQRSAFVQSPAVPTKRCQKTVRVLPSVQLTTSSLPSPSRSAKMASSTSRTLPTVTRGHAWRALAYRGFKYSRTSPPSSQLVTMSGNPSPLMSPSFTPSAPVQVSSMAWRVQTGPGEATTNRSSAAPSEPGALMAQASAASVNAATTRRLVVMLRCPPSRAAALRPYHTFNLRGPAPGFSKGPAVSLASFLGLPK